MATTVVASVSLYQPLTEPDSIRLIELLPAPQLSCEVECRLIHTSLSQIKHTFFGHYTAMSYVWGNPEKTKIIYVDGIPLAITTNLFSALRDSRDKTKPMRIWVDAVCINQQDDKEKSFQVPLMGRIYASALNAII